MARTRARAVQIHSADLFPFPGRVGGGVKTAGGQYRQRSRAVGLFEFLNNFLHPTSGLTITINQAVAKRLPVKTLRLRAEAAR